MSHPLPHFAIFALLAGASIGCSHAASSATSVVSDSASSTASSASDSVKGSSNSSSRGTGMAAGDYRLIQVADTADRAGMVTMRLARADQPAVAHELEVTLPKTAFSTGSLNVGEILRVREKAYGWELVNAGTQQAFFLVLADKWHKDLSLKPVVL